MAIIDGKQRSADATVMETARLAVLSRDDFLSFIHDNPKVALEMLSATFSRLRRTDKMLQQRVSRNVNVVYEKSLKTLDRLAIAITNRVGFVWFLSNHFGMDGRLDGLQYFGLRSHFAASARLRSFSGVRCLPPD
jgi:cAMP-binding proteins - catabolite gene activator and regulatory subunit of cAMP-dependent protein kinases